jgi:two-component system response regulator YesN
MYKLLVVDDEIAVTNGIANDINWNDIGIRQVFTANTGRSALEFMQSERIDVIVSDICMPDVDGMMMARYIREQGFYTKVIFLSGYDDFKYAQEAVTLKAFRYLVKPVRYGELKNIVHSALEEIAMESYHGDYSINSGRGNNSGKNVDTSGGRGNNSGNNVDRSGARHNRFMNAYPPFCMLVESMQTDKALERINLMLAECQGPDIHAQDGALKIYQLVSGDILDVSMRNSLRIDQWANGLEYGFFSFERFQSVEQLRQWCEGVTSAIIGFLSTGDGVTRSLAARAKTLLQSNLKNKTLLPEIAAALYVHPNYLSRAFKKSEGVTITDYIIRLRMDWAKSLLSKKGVRMYEVAEAVGYDSIAHFSRIFKRNVGMNPKEYQKKQETAMP